MILLQHPQYLVEGQMRHWTSLSACIFQGIIEERLELLLCQHLTGGPKVEPRRH
jgi:hypothetical protein